MMVQIHKIFLIINFFKSGKKMNLLNPVNLKTPANYLILYLPSFIVSLLIAETFFKFHSFTLELLAFLGTWYAIFVIGRALLKIFEKTKNI
jgi:hypothetical protein